MGNGSPLDNLLGDITGGGGTSGIEGELIQDAEGMVQQKTGFDASSLVSEGESMLGMGGGQAPASTDDSQ